MSDPPNDKINYRWEFGDGNTDTSETASNTYAGAGLYTVCLVVTDTNGDINTDCTIAEIREAPIQAVGGVTNFFSGSGSSSGGIALLAGGIAAVVAIAAGGWYTRRRWLDSRSWPPFAAMGGLLFLLDVIGVKE